MNVLVLSFYADFSRFFDFLAIELKYNFASTKVFEFCLHPSSAIYKSKHKDKSIFLASAVRSSSYKDCEGIICNELLKYIDEYNTLSGHSLSKKLIIKYYLYMLNFITDNEIDFVIISGDTRFQSRVLKIACDFLNVRYRFFEQGPYSTTTFDKNGTNCKVSFAESVYCSSNSKNLRFINAGQNKIMLTKYRLFDYLFSALGIGKLYPEIKEEKKISQIIKRTFLSKKSHKENNIAFSGFILLLGQVPTDANSLLYQKYDWEYVILKIKERFPKIKMVFREHPLYKGLAGDSFYHFCAQSGVDISSTDLSTDIKNAICVVTANSQAGLEALLKFKKTLFLIGDASYKNLNGVFNIQELFKMEIHDFNTGISHSKFLENKIWFMNNFLDGHFRDENLNNLTKKMIEYVREDLQS